MREHTKIQRKYYLRTALALFFLLSLCCTPSLSPLKSESETISYELIAAREQDILAAASEAIQSRFPDAVVSNLSGKEKGFTFSTPPFVDSPTYKFLIKKAYGMTQERNDIVGYRYFIYSDGQLLSPEASDVQPLIIEFKKELADKGIELIQVRRIETDVGGS